MDLKSSHAQSHAAFNTIMSLYQEKVFEGGLYPMTAQPSNPYVNPAPKISRTPPSTSDFIADVEKAAHRSLTEPEGMYFDVYYKSTDVIVSETDSVEYDNSLSEHILKYHESKRTEAATYDSQMRHKVGTELIRVGIYPIAQYLSPTVTSG